MKGLFKIDKRIPLLLLIVLVVGVIIRQFQEVQLPDLLKVLITNGILITTVVILFWSNTVVFSLKLRTGIQVGIWFWISLIACLVFCLATSSGVNLDQYDSIFLIQLLGIVFVQTFAEELIFRGLLINSYLVRGVKIRQAVFYSALLFGGMHLINLSSNPDPISVLNQTAMATFMGVFLGALYIHVRNIYWMGLLHLLINLPSYLKKYPNTFWMEYETTPASEMDLTSNLISSFLILIMFSPFLISGLLMLREKTLSKLNLDTTKKAKEKAFSRI
ncbi:CPBP family intramembrane glutamic endopeptidase [Gilvibacter sediminis]|uniref:CPBP family intramembrane glutamic endopeptidase n=1 Tax=Gilvibacter sediminis TaxID=379071 RepID=UPI00234FD2D4|nr:CPBP family intramembrane glutamic endopeptidase [Gilvibacter sediminis]MDC7996719.1 CPBP family intramembrane metalloprotease [Gilvibacter sediminis]